MGFHPTPGFCHGAQGTNSTAATQRTAEKCSSPGGGASHEWTPILAGQCLKGYLWCFLS